MRGHTLFLSRYLSRTLFEAGIFVKVIYISPICQLEASAIYIPSIYSHEFLLINIPLKEFCLSIKPLYCTHLMSNSHHSSQIFDRDASCKLGLLQ